MSEAIEHILIWTLLCISFAVQAWIISKLPPPPDPRGGAGAQ